MVSTRAGRMLRNAFIPSASRKVVIGPDPATAGELAATEAGWTAISVLPSSLDDWCREAGVRRIDWLTPVVDADAVLSGARALLETRRIEFVEFDDAAVGGRPEPLYDFLRGFGYSLFRFADGSLEYHKGTPPPGEGRLHLAVAPRHWGRLFSPDKKTMLRYAESFQRHGIVPRGIIHVGAHMGEEYGEYVEAGCRRVVFVEADPDTFDRLLSRFVGNPDVLCLNAAVSDGEGTARFHRMSGSQSSSLLRPTGHLRVYPGITPTDEIEVSTTTLPAALTANGVDLADFNVLALDTQGAETRILRGCGEALDAFDAVIAEVSYAELYEGSGLIDDVDDILFARGFQRVEEVAPFDHTWGDALYTRRRRRVSREPSASNPD